jgi:AcrR family transcriptional regulator
LHLPTDLPQTRSFSDHEIRLVRQTYAAIARVGAQQLSLRGIAKECEVSPALLLYHFGSHENLLIETMRWALTGTVRRIRRTIADVEDPEERLARLIDAVFLGPRENRDFHLVYMDLVQLSLRKSSFAGLTDLLREHINGSYAAVIAQGVDAGVFEVTDVERAARRARAVVEGGFLQWIQEDDWEETHGALRRDCLETLRRLMVPT